MIKSETLACALYILFALVLVGTGLTLTFMTDIGWYMTLSVLGCLLFISLV